MVLDLGELLEWNTGDGTLAIIPEVLPPLVEYVVVRRKDGEDARKVDVVGNEV